MGLSRPFHEATANGYNRGDGTAGFIIKRLGCVVARSVSITVFLFV